MQHFTSTSQARLEVAEEHREGLIRRMHEWADETG